MLKAEVHMAEEKVAEKIGPNNQMAENCEFSQYF
jgi:hypothetical protein